jgi:UTP--glucose-1-phosphate uridylyltransferase
MMHIKSNLLPIQGYRMIRKCLFPAAGYGTRFLPATKVMPKEMLPILDRPLIQYGVEEAMEAGIKNMAIVTGRGKRALEDHFDVNYELEHQIRGTSKASLLASIDRLIDNCTFSYTRQTSMLGLGHAILTGEPLIGNEPFAVVLADDLCVGAPHGVLSQMVAIFNRFQCSVVAVEEVPISEIHKYGVIAGTMIEEDLIQVTNMVEKPMAADAPSNLAIIGRYILTPDIFDILESTQAGAGGEIQLTDAIRAQAQQGKVIAYKFKGQRFDCGSPSGFVAATNHFYHLSRR